jgi:ABC-type polysaccharide/polyol phosphate transport system ATPase subunit
MSIVDLRFDHVGKRYRINQDDRRGLAGRVNRSKVQTDFWAVKDVSFDIHRGESVGIIGHNGAGKSTILKLLSSITAPSKGEITIKGRLAALLEVGSGFHPELTGRENVFLSGSILGMRRSEISQKLEDIIDFAEVRQFIDVPVKRYSSGMFVRLGFAIAAHLDPDVLLLDEVLAVGDSAFQDKCIERILALRDAGKTIVFISHDLSAVERLCSRVLLMKAGELIADGKTSEMIAKYQESTAFIPSQIHQHDVGKARVAEVNGVHFMDSDGNPTSRFRAGHPLRVRMSYSARERIRNGVFGVYFCLEAGGVACQFSTAANGELIDIEAGEGTVEFDCEQLGLQPGSYHIDATIERLGDPDFVDWHYRCTTISVEKGRALKGNFLVPHTWRRVETGPSVDRQTAASTLE